MATSCAVIRLEVKRPSPPAGVSLTFHIKEGPTVKVGRISFPGAKALPNRELIGAMKNH